ncbi:MAG: peptidase C15 [Pseudomonadota bacterium]
MTRLLVTGFGPFPGVPRNPTTDLIQALARHRWDGVRFFVLPTHFALEDELRAAAGASDRVLMFGVSGRARQLRYERVSRPGGSALPDQAGARSAGPWRSRRTAFDVTALAAAARRAGFPAVPSDDAGRYVCNASYGMALSVNPRSLFVHVPPTTRHGPLSGDGLVRHATWLIAALGGAMPQPGVRRGW